jgi:hypothetical protein
LQWIEIFSLVEHLADILESGIKDVPLASRYDVPHIFEALDKLARDPKYEESSSFTAAERVYLDFVLMIARTISDLAREANDSEEQVQILDEMEDTLQENQPHFLLNKVVLSYTEQGPEKCGVVLDNEFFHRAYLRLDALRLGSLMVGYLRVKLGARADDAVGQKLKEVHELFEDRRDDLCIAVRIVKDKLSESGVLQHLVEVVLERDGSEQTASGAALENLVGGEIWVETFASGLMESWESNLNGILKVKLFK